MSRPTVATWIVLVSFLLTNFLAGRHTKVVIHSVSLSLPVSSLRQQPCLKSQNNRAMVVPRARRVYDPNYYVLVKWNRATTKENLHHVFYKCPYFSVGAPCFSFASRLSVRLYGVSLVFQAGGCQFF
jgi:hypothetical protein